MNTLSILYFSPDDLLLPKSYGGWTQKNPLISVQAPSCWVIKETQILPKLNLGSDSHSGRSKFVEYKSLLANTFRNRRF
jgi:hypothetical protein